jgi:hypothetical protein
LRLQVFFTPGIVCHLRVGTPRGPGRRDSFRTVEKAGILSLWQCLPLLRARCVFRNDVDSLASEVPPSVLTRWRAVVRVLRSPMDANSCIPFWSSTRPLSPPFLRFAFIPILAAVGKAVSGRRTFAHRQHSTLYADTRDQCPLLRAGNFARNSPGRSFGRMRTAGARARVKFMNPKALTAARDSSNQSSLRRGDKGCRLVKL